MQRVFGLFPFHVRLHSMRQGASEAMSATHIGVGTARRMCEGKWQMGECIWLGNVLFSIIHIGVSTARHVSVCLMAQDWLMCVGRQAVGIL